MTDPPPRRDSRQHTGVDAGTPRWVKVSWIIGIALVLLLAIALLVRVSGGGHGPSRHALAGSGDTPRFSVSGDHTPPEARRI